MGKLIGIATFFSVVGWLGAADGQYILELKNGRKLTVQSYREEGSMIKFSGLGGEIAISKAQVQAIRRAGGTAESGALSLDLDRLSPTLAPTQPAEAPKSADVKPSPASPETNEQPAKKRAEEEKAYQAKIEALTKQLLELRERYSMSTRGNKGSEPSFFTTEESFKGHQEDLLSRLRDAQYRAQGLASGSNAATPPPSVNPPAPYSAKQKELSDLRNQISRVESERQQLIEEMKAKNFETGSLFLD